MIAGGDQGQSIGDAWHPDEARWRHTVRVSNWISIRALRHADDVIGRKTGSPARSRNDNTVARERRAILGPGEQIASVIRCVHRPDHAEYGQPVADDSDGDRVTAIAALHGRRPVIWIDYPHAALAWCRVVHTGLFSEKTPAWKRGQEEFAHRKLRFVVRRALADLSARTIRPCALSQQDAARDFRRAQCASECVLQMSQAVTGVRNGGRTPVCSATHSSSSSVNCS